MKRGTFRIIAGEWRGRRLSFVDDGRVRPTPDRVRETLFNWLMPRMQSARCLDLFAGSGALGLEALSRGAGHVDFIDRDSRVIRQINDTLILLDVRNAAQTHQRTAESFVNTAADNKRNSYDIVFVDPPYRQNALAKLLTALPPLLSASSRVYAEWASDETVLLPAGWQTLRSGKAGQVAYHLLQYDALGSPTEDTDP